MDGQTPQLHLLKIWEHHSQLADWATELVIDRFDVHLSFATVVTDARALVLSAASNDPSLPPVRELPLSQTICAEVARGGEAITVSDARQCPIFGGNEEVQRFGLVAYLGVPLLDASGVAVGALCAWDTKPRAWSQDDIDALARYAAVLSDQLARRQVEMELAQACRRLEQLDIVVPHEIRTPLTAIMGCLEMLLDGDADVADVTERKWLLDMANRNGLRLMNFVEKMPL